MTDAQRKRFSRELESIAGSAPTYVDYEKPAWYANFDEEIAALRVAWKYRFSKVHMGKAPMGGWYVSCRPPEA